MNNHERTIAILNYQDYDRLPVVHFGYWRQTLQAWAKQGHIPQELADNYEDGNAWDLQLNEMLGWDFCWRIGIGVWNDLDPPFERKILKTLSDGSMQVLERNGTVVLEKPGVVSIPSEIDHTLKDRASWEEHYLPRLQFSPDRIRQVVEQAAALPAPPDRDRPIAITCGSMLGLIRNWLGVVGLSYLSMDDEDLLDEMIDSVGNLALHNVTAILDSGFKPDYAHYWEDICFKNGPLVNPTLFDEKVGPYYQRVSNVLGRHGVTLTSLDCDGLIDALIPTWLKNGVNVMFPIEVGTWNASIAPWRETYGREIRGVGGMDKRIFALDRVAIDAEIERLSSLVDLGGYIPCPDHRIPPDAKWDNVQYYCEKMRETFD